MNSKANEEYECRKKRECEELRVEKRESIKNLGRGSMNIIGGERVNSL